MRVWAPVVDVNWIPNVSSNTIYDVQRKYKWYRGVVHDDYGF